MYLQQNQHQKNERDLTGQNRDNQIRSQLKQSSLKTQTGNISKPSPKYVARIRGYESGFACLCPGRTLNKHLMPVLEHPKVEIGAIWSEVCVVFNSRQRLFVRELGREREATGSVIKGGSKSNTVKKVGRRIHTGSEGRE